MSNQQTDRMAMQLRAHTQTTVTRQVRSLCMYLGEPTGDKALCPTCAGKVELKVFNCSVYGTCTVTKKAPTVEATCNRCTRYTPREVIDVKLIAPPGSVTNSIQQMAHTHQPVINTDSSLTWAYGVTTTPARRVSHLPRTLASLTRGGFTNPHLFIDNCTVMQAAEYSRMFKGCLITSRYPAIRTYGNMMLALAELYIRNPHAQRYALFQDDMVTYINLRRYLELNAYPSKSYLNLYTFPLNEKLCRKDPKTGETITGWHLTSQKGLGAVGLVFSNEALVTLLFHSNTLAKPKADKNHWRTVDGMIVTTMLQAGYKEYVHYPSLVQHTGITSTIDKRSDSKGTDKEFPTFNWQSHTISRSFKGENFDALDLLPK